MNPLVPKFRLVAFYLPQFHPIPENDRWWGKGFTEWTNVVKARPLFRSHYQPHLPAELGFYDLRVPEVREAQAELARQHGIYGFCYYHYWFGGRRLLERPFDEVLASGKPVLPFCLCWANENWTRRWDGEENEVLMEQTYSPEDNLNHVRWLCTAFRDPRYIRIDGKPLFLVYRAFTLPNAKRTIALWREEAAKEGFPGLYLCRVERSDPRESGVAPEAQGFDAAVEFQPDFWNLGPALRRGWKSRIAAGLRLLDPIWLQHDIHHYQTLVQRMLGREKVPYKRFPCVTPGWDNLPRRRVRARIFIGSTPTLYEEWLRAVALAFEPPSREENFIFVNAWNEWGEGCHLEPCQRWGRSYLEATRRVVLGH